MPDDNRTNNVLDRALALAAICTAIFAMWTVATMWSSRGATPRANGLVEKIEGNSLRVSVKDAAIDGVATAQLAIVEFSDFDCPFCGRHALESLPSLRRDYVSSGKVKYAFLNFPLEAIHPRALGAAKLAKCAADQSKFWEMHDWLFTNRSSRSVRDVTNSAESMAIDGPRLNDCLQGADERVRREMEEARRVGVKSTPTFLIGELSTDGTVTVRRRINGAAPLQAFEETLTELLEQSPGVLSGLSRYLGH